MNAPARTLATFILLAVACSLAPLSAARAERPAAPRLLPRETLAYFRVHDVPELKQKFSESMGGKLAADEQLQPLLGQLWQSAGELFQPLADDLGLSLQQLVDLPQGEFCLALVSLNKGRPVLVGLMDVGDKGKDADVLVERAEQAMAEDGARRSTEMYGEVELVIHRFPGDAGRQLVYFQREGVLAAATDLEVAQGLLARWDGAASSDGGALADNRKFTGIMRQSAGTRDERPQLTWFVDPLTLAKRVGRGNLSFQTVIALLEPLGLDGVEAVGGSVILGAEEFDAIAHFHLALSNPRKRVLDVLAMTSGETAPEPWVPRDVASYMTLHWDAAQSYDAVEEVYNLIRGEDAWGKLTQRRLSDRIGIDPREDVVEQLEGRVTVITWMQKPARLNSQSRLIGLKLKEPERFRATLAEVTGRFAASWESKSFSGQPYYQLVRPRREERREDGGERTRLTRRRELVLGLLGDYLMISDSEKLLQQVVIAKSDPDNSLAKQLDYKLIASKIKRHAGSSKPGMVYFDRPEEGMRLLYDLLTGDATRDRLSDAAQSNQVWGALDRALRDNPLPPFHRIARYLAPRGGMMINDETGFHYTVFSLRRD